MKILAALILFSFLAITNAQVPLFKYDYPITCGPVVPIIEVLSKTQKKKLSWTGIDIADGSVYSLWEDKDGNWTLLKMSTEIACILGIGTKPEIV